jgi:hypothetical protein
MKYGSNKGDVGDPPDMTLAFKARESTNTPMIVMVSSYRQKDKITAGPQRLKNSLEF